MPLQSIADKIQVGLGKSDFIDTLKFDCGDDGVIVIADKQTSLVDQATDCTIRISARNLEKLVAGNLNPMTGVMMGKLKISGDTSVALKLGKLLKG